VPQRLSQLEQSLIGVKAALAPHVVTPDQLSHLAPLDDVRATAAYRLQAALVLVQRSLAQFALPMEKAALEKAA
jgi:CO/xanthine dehydrogenase FAD-binding subunit